VGVAGEGSAKALECQQSVRAHADALARGGNAVRGVRNEAAQCALVEGPACRRGAKK
jgi:hypothetical protein